MGAHPGHRRVTSSPLSERLWGPAQLQNRAPQEREGQQRKPTEQDAGKSVEPGIAVPEVDASNGLELELEAQRMYRRGKLIESRKSRLYSCSRVQQKVRVDLIVCPLLTKSAAVRAPDDVPGGNLQNANVRHCVLLLANASGKHLRCRVVHPAVVGHVYHRQRVAIRQRALP